MNHQDYGEIMRRFSEVFGTWLTRDANPLRDHRHEAWHKLRNLFKMSKGTPFADHAFRCRDGRPMWEGRPLTPEQWAKVDAILDPYRAMARLLE